MGSKTRRLLGTVLLLAWVVVYSLVAMVIGSALLTKFDTLGRTLVYLVGGFVWLPPAMWLISWMYRGAPRIEPE